MFTNRSKAVLLWWIIYVICVLFCYAFVHVCLSMPCGHLLGKGWPLGSRLWCLIATLSLSDWYLKSAVVLDCINSWYMPSFLYCCSKVKVKIRNRYNQSPRLTQDTKGKVATSELYITNENHQVNHIWRIPQLSYKSADIYTVITT